ncbi:hypothetical protein ACET3X_006554 [Alternaria dauci]|uniref:Uncharacterized protein n=1 Tax=Alternaria dauci TaxID=48095 RepID=A0ABR3UE34_9PLEO
MAASKKQPKQRHIQHGGIYTTLDASECNAQGITTSLKGKAWGHPVLVLGPHAELRNCFRIMTITSSPPDYENTIPFAPLRKDKRHPMQLRLAHFEWLPEPSYLRIEKEYWIERKGLDDELGRIPLKGSQGLSKLTELVGKTRSREEQDKLVARLREQVKLELQLLVATAEAERARAEALASGTEAT